MTEMISNEKVMVFVDVRNVLGAMGDDLRYSRIDFNGLIRNLTMGRYIVHSYAYDGHCDADGSDENLHNYLRRCGCTVRLSNVHRVDSGQKGVDVDLATDMVLFACRGYYDTAILVSGDGDFIPAVEKVKDMGKRIEVACFENTINDGLRLSADTYRDLDGVPLMKLRGPRNPEVVL